MTTPALSAIGLSLVLAASLGAEELAIEPQPFTLITGFEAKVMPVEPAALLQLEPKSSSGFTIRSLTAHGASVKKGDVVVAFEADAIDQRIEDLESQTASRKLELADAASEFARLEETSPARLAALRHAAQVASENLAHFTETDRKTSEETSARRVERSKEDLENQQEELRQLKAMYEADDLTEETEEIILTRQQNAVRHAEFALRMQQLYHERQISVELPRRAVELAESARQTAVDLKYAEESIPRAIALKQASLKELETTQQRALDELDELRHDRQLCEIKAATDGVFYHGAVDGGKWVTGELLRTLRVGGSAPLHQPFASIVRSGGSLGLSAFVDAGTAGKLATGARGTAFPAGREDSEFPVEVTSVSTTPETNGQYHVVLKPEWPKALSQQAAVGNPVNVNLLCHHNPTALVVPAKALKQGAKGWTVEVKLADGKTEARAVKRGRQSGDDVEILDGLVAGQVVVVP